MKNITFTSSQRNLLKKFLKFRLTQYYVMIENTSSKNVKYFQKKYIQPLLSSLEKINYDSAHYQKREMATLISCVNEHYDEIYNINKHEILENCNLILLKCNYKRDFRLININSKLRIQI